MPISIDKHFDSYEAFGFMVNFVKRMRLVAKDAGCVTWSWSHISGRDYAHCLRFQYADTIGLEPAQINLYFNHQTSRGELFLNTFSVTGSSSKGYAKRLAIVMQKHGIPCRVTKLHKCDGVAVNIDVVDDWKEELV